MAFTQSDPIISSLVSELQNPNNPANSAAEIQQLVDALNMVNAADPTLVQSFVDRGGSIDSGGRDALTDEPIMSGIFYQPPIYQYDANGNRGSALGIPQIVVPLSALTTVGFYEALRLADSLAHELRHAATEAAQLVSLGRKPFLDPTANISLSDRVSGLVQRGLSHLPLFTVKHGPFYC
jgi:hypothetical protein